MSSMEERVKSQLAANAPQTSITLLDDPAPEELFCPMISVDDHILEPPSLFEGRMPAALADRVPHVVTDDVGLAWWHIDDQVLPIPMGNGASGRPRSEWSLIGIGYEHTRLGVWDPVARLHDMDLVGVWAQLCFCSTVWGFAGKVFSGLKDTELGLACIKAYNDWLVEEWCATAPDRFVACQVPWLRDPKVAAEEIYRNAARGVTAVSFSENPEGLGYANVYDRVWDPFFAACEETRTVVNLHVGSSGQITIPCSSSATDALAALVPINGFTALVDWLYAGIPTRFPKLQIVLSEAGVSWVPMALERLGRAHKHGLGNNEWPDPHVSPIEQVRRNFAFTSIEDPSAFRNLDIIGEDNVMVETDYPHFDSTWPECQAMIRSELEHLDTSTIRKICFENAARIYRTPEPPAEMFARSLVGSRVPA